MLASLVDVNVQLVVGNVALIDCCAADLYGQACAHLGPDERHLSSQPKLTPCLLDTILGAGQHAPQKIWNVFIWHTHTIVLY